MKMHISLEEAQGLVLERCRVLPAEVVRLALAGGRVLAAAVTAPGALPEWEQSAVDGFALGSGDAPAGTEFELIGSLRPGESAAVRLNGSQAMGVTTGGALPAGTAAVVPHERARVEAGRLIIEENAKTGNNIKAVGEDYRQGETLLPAGQVIDGGAAALLAAFGIPELPVVRRPKVTLLSLAENLVNYEEPPAAAQVRDSNLPMLRMEAERLGAEVFDELLLPPAQLAARADELRQLWKQSDIIISSGLNYTEGENESDILTETIRAKGVFGEVEFMPGSHVALAEGEGKLLLSLSGNPASCAVGFHLLAAPALIKMQGKPYRYDPIPMRLTAAFDKKSGSRRFARAYAECGLQGWSVTVTPGQKPSMIRSLVGCNALIDIPAGTPGLAAGDLVQVYLLK